MSWPGGPPHGQGIGGNPYGMQVSHMPYMPAPIPVSQIGDPKRYGTPKIKSTLKYTPVADPTRPVPEARVYVGKWVVDNVHISMIKSLASFCGEIKDFYAPTNPLSGKYRGFGFVTYKEPEEAEVAITVLSGCELAHNSGVLQITPSDGTKRFLEWLRKDLEKKDLQKKGLEKKDEEEKDEEEKDKEEKDEEEKDEEEKDEKEKDDEEKDLEEDLEKKDLSEQTENGEPSGSDRLAEKIEKARAAVDNFMKNEWQLLLEKYSIDIQDSAPDNADDEPNAVHGLAQGGDEADAKASSEGTELDPSNQELKGVPQATPLSETLPSESGQEQIEIIEQDKEPESDREKKRQLERERENERIRQRERERQERGKDDKKTKAFEREKEKERRERERRVREGRDHDAKTMERIYQEECEQQEKWEREKERDRRMLEELATEAITRRAREILEEETLSDGELDIKQRRRATKDRNRSFRSSFRDLAYIYELPEDRKRRREIEKEEDDKDRAKELAEIAEESRIAAIRKKEEEEREEQERIEREERLRQEAAEAERQELERLEEERLEKERLEEQERKRRELELKPGSAESEEGCIPDEEENDHMGHGEVEQAIDYPVHGPELPPMFGPNLPKRTLEPTDRKTKFDLGKLKPRTNPIGKPALVSAEEEEETKKPKKKRLELPLPDPVVEEEPAPLQSSTPTPLVSTISAASVLLTSLPEPQKAVAVAPQIMQDEQGNGKEIEEKPVEKEAEKESKDNENDKALSKKRKSEEKDKKKQSKRSKSEKEERDRERSGRDRDSSRKEKDESRRDKDSSKREKSDIRERDGQKREKYDKHDSRRDKESSKRDRDDSKRNRDDSKRDRGDSKRDRGDSKRDRGDSKRDRDDSKRDRDDSKRDRGDSKRVKDDSKRSRDDSKRSSDSSKYDKDRSRHDKDSSRRDKNNSKKKSESSKSKDERERGTEDIKASSTSKDKELVKVVISKVPTEKAAVFAYKVDWKAFVNECRSKIENWLKKKVAEYVAQDGDSESESAVGEIVEFVISKLDKNRTAEDLMEEMQPFLDNDAEGFVYKLYRTLIFETLLARERKR